MSRKFAHELVLCVQKGRWKAYCRCGKQSRKLGSMEEARQAHSYHLKVVGIAESAPKSLVMS